MENDQPSGQSRELRISIPEDQPASAPAKTGTSPSEPVAGGAEEAQFQGAPTPVVPGSPTDAKGPFHVVGVGASAGGLAALEQFCSALPADADLDFALVLVQHLDPDHKSMLTDLLRQYTRVEVREAEDGVEIRPGAAYVIPPNKDMALVDGKLRLLEPSRPRGLRLPVDFFFRSLAQERRHKAVGIVLSGTGTDGTLGSRAIKESGGLVMVQSPDTAQYDGMPRSAIATGLVDFILPPGELPIRLIEYIDRSTGKPAREIEASLTRDGRHSEPLQRIFALLRAQVGHDFSRYKQNTILRRIERRMAVHQIESVEDYTRHLQQNPAEVTTLFRELLIGVTNFFRDPEAFDVLAERVIPALFATKRSGEVVRIWVPGCSTGEEAYSIAMLAQEHMSKVKPDVRVQVFATDIDREAIDLARQGSYPNSVAADITPDRLARFFTEEGNTYCLKKAIRDMVVFAEQNVTSDPPFSRIDLISCRNLLIYLNSELQRRVLPLFHYALNPMGYLLLGTSETVGEFADLFAPVDRRWKLYVRKPGGLPHRSSLDFKQPGTGTETPSRRSAREARPETRLDVRQVMEQALLAQHTPPAVVVSADGDVMYVHGRTGLYLEPAEGEASLNVLRMAREGLRLDLTTALHRAVSSQEKVTQAGISIRSNEGYRRINLIVRPMPEAPVSGLYLIVFEPIPPTGPREADHREIAASDKDSRIELLERDLRAKEDHLQTAIEELETSNEELTSTNEELQSANEELQSTNEELETSKEELQSVNEELMTVNVELQQKIEELSRLNNDLNNLLSSTGIGTVFVDHLLRIQRFTPAITETINLTYSDIGRPIGHLMSNLLGYKDLIKDVTAVLDTLVPRERDVQAKNDRWYLMRIQPYRTIENIIKGAVITFVDITSQKKMQAAIEQSRHLRIESMFDPALIASMSGRVLDCNRDALVLFGYEPEELSGLRLADLVLPDSYWRLREAMEEAERHEMPAFSLKLRKKDGTVVATDARMGFIDSNAGNALLMVLRETRERGNDATDA